MIMGIIKNLFINSGITAIYTDRHHGDVKSLCLIAPAGIPVKLPASARFAMLLLTGEYVMNLAGDLIIFR